MRVLIVQILISPFTRGKIKRNVRAKETILLVSTHRRVRFVPFCTIFLGKKLHNSLSKFYFIPNLKAKSIYPVATVGIVCEIFLVYVDRVFNLRQSVSCCLLLLYSILLCVRPCRQLLIAALHWEIRIHQPRLPR